MAKPKEIISPLAGKDVELIFTKGDRAFKRVMEYTEAVSVLMLKHPTIKKKPGWTYQIHQIGNSQFKNVKEI
jgi:hypothetical protein